MIAMPILAILRSARTGSVPCTARGSGGASPGSRGPGDGGGLVGLCLLLLGDEFGVEKRDVDPIVLGRSRVYSLQTKETKKHTDKQMNR